MRTFLAGLAVAVVLTAGTAYLFQATRITSAERFSPAQSVRVDAEASNTAKGTGYGAPKEKADNRNRQTEQETAGR